jgi:low affinity Fe/Cu permease
MPHSDGWRELTRGSRVLHYLGETGAHVLAGSTAALIAVMWIIVGLFSGFPKWWATVLCSVGALTTFVMVFVIQHTQARQTLAMQRKLDEVLRSLRGADNAFVAVEEAPDDDLHALAELAFRDREDATSAGPAPSQRARRDH